MKKFITNPFSSKASIFLKLQIGSLSEGFQVNQILNDSSLIKGEGKIRIKTNKYFWVMGISLWDTYPEITLEFISGITNKQKILRVAKSNYPAKRIKRFLIASKNSAIKDIDFLEALLQNVGKAFYEMSY